MILARSLVGWLGRRFARSCQRLSPKVSNRAHTTEGIGEWECLLSLGDQAVGMGLWGTGSAP